MKEHVLPTQNLLSNIYSLAVNNEIVVVIAEKLSIKSNRGGVNKRYWSPTTKEYYTLKKGHGIPSLQHAKSLRKMLQQEEK